MTASPISSRRVVAVSFWVDVFDAVSNLVVAAVTGSAVVFAEMAQGIADSLGSGFLVIGERRARRPRDAEHPLGYQREAFFWSLLSGVVMLVVGAGLSVWRGYQQLVVPEPLEHSLLAVAVVALAVVTNGYAVSLSIRKLSAEGGSLRGAFRDRNRPLVKSALLRDAIGTASSVLGLVALGLYQALGWVALDALGALVAAALMAVAAITLIAQARELITGRSLPPDELQRLHDVALGVPEVVAVNFLAAVYSGTRHVLVDLDLDLAEDLDTTRIEAVLDEVEARIREAVPETERVRVELSSPEESRPKRAADSTRP
jgi:cation diffusion facilitator family transporter